MNLRRPQIKDDIASENCFDFLRLFLAVSVLFSHYDKLHGVDFIHFPVSLPLSVSGFFVISGILIYRSFCRSSSLKSYFVKRVKRIFPAYVLVVLLSSLVFSFFSDLPASDYFLSSDFFRYLAANLTTLNFIQPNLPGVRGLEAVNPSLWTIKIELMLYLLVPVFAWLFDGKRRVLSVVAVAVVSSVSIFLRWKADVSGVPSYDLLGKWIALAACFLAGVSLFLFRVELKKCKWFLIVPAVALLMVDGYAVELVHPFAVGIAVYFFAFTLPFLNRFGKIGDLSYGTYVFHGPIVNVTICMGWTVCAGNFLLTVLMVLLVAFLSWHLLEKRILGR